MVSAGRRRFDAAEWSLRHQQTFVVTKGSEGVSVASPSDYFELGAPTIQPVDTVGAGDTFCGYLAAALDLRDPLQAAVNGAVTAASIACLKAGANRPSPQGGRSLRRDELECSVHARLQPADGSIGISRGSGRSRKAAPNTSKGETDQEKSVLRQFYRLPYRKPKKLRTARIITMAPTSQIRLFMCNSS